MVTVELLRDGITYTVTAKGHATGSPEMCAAVSTLMCMAAGWAQCEERAKVLRADLESGDAKVSWRGVGEPVFDALEVGFRQLELTDPERIRVEKKIF